MCSSPLRVAQCHCPQLLSDCESLKDKFEPLFTLFGRCHSVYSSNRVNSVPDLGKVTVQFMGNVRFLMHTSPHSWLNTYIFDVLSSRIPSSIYHSETSFNGRSHDTISWEMEWSWFRVIGGTRGRVCAQGLQFHQRKICQHAKPSGTDSLHTARTSFEVFSTAPWC